MSASVITEARWWKQTGVNEERVIKGKGALLLWGTCCKSPTTTEKRGGGGKQAAKHDRLTLWTGAAAAAAIFDNDDDDVCPVNTKEVCPVLPQSVKAVDKQELPVQQQRLLCKALSKFMQHIEMQSWKVRRREVEVALCVCYSTLAASIARDFEKGLLLLPINQPLKQQQQQQRGEINHQTATRQCQSNSLTWQLKTKTLCNMLTFTCRRKWRQERRRRPPPPPLLQTAMH